MKKLLSCLSIVLLLNGCFSSDSKDKIENPIIPPPQAKPIERPDNQTCLAHEPPQIATNVKFDRVYPNLDMSSLGIAIQLYRMPNNNDEWFVIGRRGYVYKFDDNANVTTATLLLDISEKVDSDYGELGLLGMAFHPDFSTNKKVYLYYSYFNEEGQRYTTLSEFTYEVENDLLVNEISILKLRQYSKNHQGGNIVFGSDGYLYFAYGDDGKGMVSQELSDLYGKFIRINVPGNGTYSIPNDNPFVGVEGARGEIWATGFRHPWRWGFDKETGELWAGDVGADNLEEVDKVVKGGNYGWPIKEGTSCTLSEGCSNYEDLIDPVLEYSHEAGWGAIIGGHVYRGKKVAGLIGRFIFADFSQYSQILSLDVDELNQPYGKVLFKGKLAPGGGIHSFSADYDDEIFVTHYNGFFKMVPDENTGTTISDFPELLSETGCFEKTSDGLTAVEAAVPFTVASSLYTDGAAKNRWMAIPDGTEIEVLENGDFIYPVGSVLLKEFSLGGKKIETRLLMKNDTQQWNGYTYEWNEEQTDALLLPAGKTVTVGDIDYQIPNRVQCQSCHNGSVNGAIGPEYRQLNMDHTYSDTLTKNQIEYLASIGFINEIELNKQDQLTALPDYHLSDFTNEQRVSSFVHSNCAYCHNPEGPARGSLDFRWQVQEQWNACNKDPEISSLGVEGAKLIAPGHPDKSIIYKRLNTTELYRMPPIGRTTIQQDVVEFLGDYINEVECK